MLPKAVTQTATVYTPGSIILTMDPVTWEYQGRVYSLETPGVPLEEVVDSLPVKGALQGPCGPPPGQLF